MRILHLISNMNPESGGPQEAVRRLMRSAPPGTHSEVATLDDPLADFLQYESHNIHALGDRRRLSVWLRAHRRRFDGVVVHGLWEPLQLSVLSSLTGHTPYVVYPHGMLDPYFKHTFPLKHAKKWLFWLTVQYRVLRGAERVVFTTATERDLSAQSFWLHRWNPAVIGLGAEHPPSNLDACKEAFFAHCPAVRNRRYLLFLGRIDPKKGCDFLLDAFTAFDRSVIEDLDLHLVIAGPDPSAWGERLRQRIKSSALSNRVHWPGMLKGPAKWGAFAGSDAFILPSHQENFGIAIVEALSCGTPALLTHAINIAADLVSDGSALVEDDTLAGTKRLISRWLSLPSEQQAAMRTSARNSVSTRYDMRKNTQALFDLFRKPQQNA